MLISRTPNSVWIDTMLCWLEIVSPGQHVTAPRPPAKNACITMSRVELPKSDGLPEAKVESQRCVLGCGRATTSGQSNCGVTGTVLQSVSNLINYPKQYEMLYHAHTLRSKRQFN